MTDALINDKPQFVRLFAENGLNILSYLTYGRLETLYRSVAVGTVLFRLLQRFLVERLGTAAFVAAPSNAQESPSKAASENVHSGPMSEISLFEVRSSGWRHSCSCFPLWKWHFNLLKFPCLVSSLGGKCPGTVDGWCLPAILLRCSGLGKTYFQKKSAEGIFLNQETSWQIIFFPLISVAHFIMNV